MLALGDRDLPAGDGSGMLAAAKPDARDALTVIGLPIREPVTPFAQVDVSNSAIGSPGAVAVSPDGHFAYVVESRKAAGMDRTVGAVPVGESLTSVDLTDPMAPKVVGTTYVGSEPQAVAVSPSGKLVAVVSRNPRSQLVIVPMAGGAVARDPISWPLIGLDDDEARPTGVAWHPSGKGLAVTLGDRGEVVFYEFTEDNEGTLSIAAWGAPVKVGGMPVMGMFTPDGTEFVTLCRGKADQVQGPGCICSIALASTADAASVHSMAASTAVGINPVGLAMNSAGTLLVCGNSAVSTGGQGGSVTLVSLAKNGELTPHAEYPIGAVPAGVTFDTRGGFVLVSQFGSTDPEAADGEVSFWKVMSGQTPKLAQQEFFVGIGSGPHGVIIVR